MPSNRGTCCKQRPYYGRNVPPFEPGDLSGAYSTRYTIFPLTIVATTFPVSCDPSNGVLRDLEWDFAASNVQRFLGSKMVTSAWLPRTSVPRPLRVNTRAGPAVKSSTMRLSEIFWLRCR